MAAEKGLIFGSIPCESWDFLQGYQHEGLLVIAADGGMRCARQAGFSPAVYVGDSDSGGQPEPGIISVPLVPEKDVTDLEAAYLWAKEQGLRELIFTGCTGGRLDHHMAAMGLLETVCRGGLKGIVLDSRNRAEFLLPGRHLVKRRGYTYFSLIPVDEVLTGVTISGAKYPLNGRDVFRGDSLTISNEWQADTATVSFTGGCCYLILSK